MAGYEGYEPLLRQWCRGGGVAAGAGCGGQWYSGCHHGEAMVESPLKLLATLEAYMYMLSTYIMLLLSASQSFVLNYLISYMFSLQGKPGSISFKGSKTL